MKKFSLVLAVFLLSSMYAGTVRADDGYRLWLKYDLISNRQTLDEYKQSIKAWMVDGTSPTMEAAKHELKMGLDGLLGSKIPEANELSQDGTLLVGTYKNSTLLAGIDLRTKLEKVGSEGFVIFTSKIKGKRVTIITANEDIGVLYGVFHFLRLLQTNEDISSLDVISYPRIMLRVLDHWDNLNGTVERGYAGFSIWDWHTLPIYIKPRYKDYARANASIGINGAVMNNVNADPLILTDRYIVKLTALASVFRPYGIKVYVAANFDAPIKLGKLKTADPLDPQVRQWWRNKVKDIYSHIPDFGGFLVKANSEGEPGPEDYGRTQADGANMLAEALKPYNGVVMWRAFVYTYDTKDRARQAYEEFKPLDGRFADNVLLQVKNGPLDFQPREPFNPLFGAMPNTPLMMEVQITMEYLGQGTSLCYLAPLFKESLESDTYAKGEGSTIGKIVDGSLDRHELTGIAGVSNIGADRNWTGHPFDQANWYAFGRLAWNHELTSARIAGEWIRMTFSNDSDVVKKIESIMMPSRENVVNYMDPLGLNMIFGYDSHYGPGPWIDYSPHKDWNSTYYHRADSIGVGFDRTKTGSDYVDQYYPPVAEQFASLAGCPDNELLWFHHVPWNHKMNSGHTLWDEICFHYYAGVDSVRRAQKIWNSLEGRIDDEEFHDVQMLLEIQENEAVWWRNACVLYFQTFSKMPIPDGFEKPDETLQYYENLAFPLAPGTW
ncbi:MAG: alpha-glucuronidase family glycosyl hydrolase [Candidatus Kryptoniota bacterium]